MVDQTIRPISRLSDIDQHTASIEEGVGIPFETQSKLGSTNTQFKKAILKLEVTPDIAPNNVILLDVLVQKDDEGVRNSDGLAIDRKPLQTRVQVENGETIVPGGVYTGTNRDNRNSGPFFSDIPVSGHMFRRTAVEAKKKELQIFITPKILEHRISVP
jgi:type IV pilus assembly protein PilQ